jgi:subtilisin-like proprotein convertase family protein
MPRAVVSLAILALITVSSSLAGAQPPRVVPGVQRQIDVLRGIKTTRSAVQNKIDSRLLLGVLKLQGDPRLASFTQFRFVRNEADGRVPVDVVTAPGGVKAVLARLDALGAVVEAADQRFQNVRARVRLEDLERLTALPEVRRVRQAMPAYHAAVNVSQGDATHGADLARTTFGTTGAGVKVCVLSDGVDSAGALAASGDVAPVDVLPGQGGAGDEGSAMLEIVHDLAPGASLGFATAFSGEAQFAQNILDLRADGCDVLVDDVIYLDESPFEDGPVAQAVNGVTADGALYFSSAGNEGNVDDLTSGTWEGDFVASSLAPPPLLAGTTLHDFGDGGSSILVESGGSFANPTPPLLIWAEHYDLTSGIASTDFDLYNTDGSMTILFDASFDSQDGSGGDDFPIEFIAGGSFPTERLLIDKFAAGSTSSQPMMNLILFRGELDDALVTEGATRGHSAALAAYSVAATPAADSFDPSTPDGPYPGPFTAANESERFTSDGRRRIILDPIGAELCPGNRTSSCAADVRQKPDITAADGVSCAAPGFFVFYGTSAAAPHAAAIAALMKHSVPAATPAQIRTAIEGSALDIEAPGDDRDTGAGIIMAGAALAAVGGQPRALLDDGPPVRSEAAGDGDAFVEPNETWTLTVPLTNLGSVAATAIGAVLSSPTVGVTVTSAGSAYPDLAPGTTGGNVTPYRFVVGGALPCGAVIDFTLTVSYTGGPSPQAFTFRVGTGAPGAPVTFTYAGPPVPIPDGTGVTPGAPVVATLPVAGLLSNVIDVDLRIDGTLCSTADGATTVGIDHTWVGDLGITLVSPASTGVLAIAGAGGSGNNFCQTLLDDESGGPSIQSAGSGSAPFTGSFTPNSPLSALDGENGNGAWGLQVQDFFAQDTGNVRAFSLILTPAVCDAPAPVAFDPAIPTLSQAGLLLLALALAGLGLRALRSRG